MILELEQQILDATVMREDGKRTISCAAAFRLAEQGELTVREIGAYCTETDIKIISCQLGCFK